MVNKEIGMIEKAVSMLTSRSLNVLKKNEKGPRTKCQRSFLSERYLLYGADHLLIEEL